MAISFSCRNGSARSERDASGVPPAADGISWKVCRSPIQGLGSWLADSASRVGRLSPLLPRAYSYSQLVDPASVTGVQKLKPCGTAVAGKVLPREKEPLELVPRVVDA